jgi:hypothetical protein
VNSESAEFLKLLRDFQALRADLDEAMEIVGEVAAQSTPGRRAEVDMLEHHTASAHALVERRKGKT